MKNIPIRQISPVAQQQLSSKLFSIRKIQDLLGGNDLFHHLHRHNFYFILALKNGDGSHDIDFTSYKVIDNSVFVLRPGQVHQLELKKDCTGFILEFNAEYFYQSDKGSAQQLRKAGNRNFCQTDPSRFDKLQGILEYIYQEYSDRQEGFNEVIQANLNIFLIELTRQSQNPGVLSTDANLYTQQRLDEFLALLETNVNDFKQVAHYTELMNLSAYQLNEITKTTLGKTPSELINEYIILEAKRYLMATSGQIKDIADHLGYEDVSYFVRFFKRHTGFSPEAYRHN